MSSAKAALESDTRTLAFEAGRRWEIRVNTISAGPLPSRAAKAIGTIERMVDYYAENAALPAANTADDRSLPLLAFGGGHHRGDAARGHGVPRHGDAGGYLAPHGRLAAGAAWESAVPVRR